MPGRFCQQNHIPRGFQAQTVPEGEIPFVKKRKFAQNFDRIVFSGKTEVPRRYKNGAIAKDWNRENIFETKSHESTEVKMIFIRKNKLSVGLHPVHWFEAMLLIKKSKVKKFQWKTCCLGQS